MLAHRVCASIHYDSLAAILFNSEFRVFAAAWRPNYYLHEIISMIATTCETPSTEQTSECVTHAFPHYKLQYIFSHKTRVHTCHFISIEILARAKHSELRLRRTQSCLRDDIVVIIFRRFVSPRFAPVGVRWYENTYRLEHTLHTRSSRKYFFN